MDLDELYQKRIRGSDGYPSAMVAFMDELKDRTREYQAPQVVEIGVNTGQSTLAFLVGLQWADGRLWSCDVENPKPPIDELIGHPKWTFVRGCSTDELVYQAAPACNILLIDGAFDNRHYDLRFYGPKVKPGGTIYVHDIDQEAIREIFDNYAGSTGHQYDILIGDKNKMGVIYVPKY